MKSMSNFLTNVQIVSQRFQPIIKANNNPGIFFSQLMWIILESWSNSKSNFLKPIECHKIEEIILIILVVQCQL